MRLAENLLRDLDDPQKRFGAILSLGQQQYLPAVEQLALFVNDSDARIRWAVIRTLGILGGSASLSIILKALNDPDLWVRAAAARALGHLHADAAVIPLIECLQDDHTVVRAAAIYALALMGNPIALQPLTILLNDIAYDWSRNGQRIADLARAAIGYIGESSASVEIPNWRLVDESSPLLDAIFEPPAVAAMPDWLKDDPESSELDSIFANTLEQDTPVIPASPQETFAPSEPTPQPVITQGAPTDAVNANDPWVEAFELEYKERQTGDVATVNPTSFLELETELPLGEPEAVPDWLQGMAVEDEEAAVPADIPDWLRQDISITEPEPVVDSVAITADVPDWLQTVDVEPAAIPDWLSDTLASEKEIIVSAPGSMTPVELAPALPPHDHTPDFDKMTPEEIMTWMESLAKKQGASEGFTTSADMQIADIDPASIVIDEPGYVPSEGKMEGKKIETITPPKPSSEPISSVANFSAYYPAEAIANRQQGLYVYAYLPDLVPTIENDVKKFREQLGGNIPAPRVAKQSTDLQHGTRITVTPECDELDFEPVSVTKKWNGEWTRFDFEFRPKTEMVGDNLFVRVSIAIGSVEISHIKCPIEVIEQPRDKVANPLRAAKLMTQTGSMYHRIFVSYSRRDTQVAEAYRLAQMAIGNDVFMDSYSIRVGEDWRAALATAIDEADIFQLFWSNHAAESENVQHEWDYALKYKCPDQHCVSFIRPVFWDKPMPQPPEPLSHLNFRFVPFNLTDADAKE